MEEILLAAAKSQGIEAETFTVAAHQTAVHFENGRLKKVETSRREGLAVRVKVGGRLGFAATTLPADPNDVLAEAIATAAFGKEAGFPFPSLPVRQEVPLFDEEVLRVTPAGLVETGEELLAPLLAITPKFKAGAHLVAGRMKITLANTAGFYGTVEKTFFGGSVGGVLVEGENLLDLGESHMSCRKTDRLHLLRDRVAGQLVHGRRNVPLATGKYQVLFAPTAVAALLGPFIASLNGKAVQKGVSPFRHRLGETIFVPSFTLRDHGLLPYAPASGPFDGEGTPSRITPLIEAGTIRNYLVDLDTATQLGLTPGGHARRRDWSSPPTPGPSTLVMAGGEEESRRLLAGIKEGVLVHHFLGAGQGNPYGGRLSANIVLGFLVREGEIVGRVKNTMLAVDVFALFRGEGLLALSRDTEEVAGGMILPFVLAEGIDLVTRE